MDQCCAASALATRDRHYEHPATLKAPKGLSQEYPNLGCYLGLFGELPKFQKKTLLSSFNAWVIAGRTHDRNPFLDFGIDGGFEGILDIDVDELQYGRLASDCDIEAKNVEIWYDISKGIQSDGLCQLRYRVKTSKSTSKRRYRRKKRPYRVPYRLVDSIRGSLTNDIEVFSSISSSILCAISAYTDIGI